MFHFSSDIRTERVRVRESGRTRAITTFIKMDKRWEGQYANEVLNKGCGLHPLWGMKWGRKYVKSSDEINVWATSEWWTFSRCYGIRLKQYNKESIARNTDQSDQYAEWEWLTSVESLDGFALLLDSFLKLFHPRLILLWLWTGKRKC